MRNRLLSVLKKGRIRHAFAIMVPVGVLVVSSVSALAYYAATGSGTITGISATSAATSVVTLTNAVAAATIAPGGSTTFPVNASCTASCPAQVSTVNLSTWSSDKTGCTPAAMPGSFSMPQLTANVLVGATSTSLGNVTVTWANLGTDQSACKGANFTFTLVTP